MKRSFERHVNVVDENDNYRCNEQRGDRQLPDAALVNLDADEKWIRIENVFSCNENHKAHQRQTTLSEYFSELPRETSTVELEQDDTPEKLINVSLLLHQLLNARVVLDRLPDKSVETPRKSGVQRYCHRCKILNHDLHLVASPKICLKCGTTLIYVCDKCNESHYYHNYRCFTRHRRKCIGEKSGMSLDNVVVMYCVECPFETLYRVAMAKHVNRTKHKILENKNFMEIEVKSKLSAYQSKYLVKQNKIDYSTVRKRYCPTCQKIVANGNCKDDESCTICNTTLLYRCGKCNHQSAHHTTLLYHLQSECCHSVYRCPECKYTTENWKIMRLHLKKSCAPPRKNVGTRFQCDHCSSVIRYKRNLKAHLDRFHKELFA